MKITFGVLLSLISAIACAEQYGAPITMKHPVSLESAVKQLGVQASAEVLLESKVDKVCKERGCRRQRRRPGEGQAARSALRTRGQWHRSQVVTSKYVVTSADRVVGLMVTSS
jgi:hypothetical protein